MFRTLSTCVPVYDGSYVNCSIILESCKMLGGVKDSRFVKDFSWLSENVEISEKIEVDSAFVMEPGWFNSFAEKLLPWIEDDVDGCCCVFVYVWIASVWVEYLVGGILNCNSFCLLQGSIV